jgi:hypothetical protein
MVAWWKLLALTGMEGKLVGIVVGPKVAWLWPRIALVVIGEKCVPGIVFARF